MRLAKRSEKERERKTINLILNHFKLTNEQKREATVERNHYLSSHSIKLCWISLNEINNFRKNAH